MRKIGRFETVFIATALVIGSTFAHFMPAAAQSETNGRPFERTKSGSDFGLMAVTDTSPVIVASKDVAGAPNEEIDLAIDIIKNQEAIIESVKLIGIPPKITVSDHKNTFTSFDENAEVDVSSWNLPKLHIRQTGRHENSFSFAVAVIWAPRSGGQIDLASSIVNVRFAAAGSSDGPGTPGKDLTRHAEVNPANRLPSGLPSPVAGAHATAAIDARRPEKTADIDQNARPAPARPTPPTDVPEALPPRPSATRSPADADLLIGRAKALIRLGDVSAARLLLERAQTRNVPGATFLLAQTWDPEVLQAWKVRGMRADPDLARRLYAKAAEQGQTGERLMTATRP